VKMTRETILSSELVEIVERNANNLINRVRVFKAHPSYDSRAELKATANSLTGQFNLVHRLNGFWEIVDDEGNNLRTLVNDAKRAVESLYDKKAS